MLTRKLLYDLVCTKSLTKLAAEYSVSVHGLRKICVEKNIPIPPNGHWSKVEFGKPSELKELPLDYTGSDEINLGKIKLVSNHDAPTNHLGKSTNESKEAQGLPFKVPLKLSNPDPLIVSTKNYHDALERYDWRSDKPKPERVNVLSIDASHACIARAYRIMDTIIKLLRARNYEFKFKYYDKTFAVLKGEEVGIRLRERYKVLPKKEKNVWESREFESTGKLVFLVGNYSKKEFIDGSKLLELKIPSIIAYIEEYVEIRIRRSIEAEQQRNLQEEQRRIAEEIKKQKDEESQKFKNLFLHATRLHQANIMRDYIETVEATSLRNHKLTSELQDWIAWAKRKADWYDPLINGEDQLLDNNYKTGIFKELLKEWQ